MEYKNTIEQVDLPSWVKESQRRKEEIRAYLVNHTTGEVVACAISPNFIAGVMKFGVKTLYKLGTK